MLLRPDKSRKGIAATELALLAPVILTLLMGLWEVGRYVAMQNLLDNAVREGGRIGSSGAYFSSNNMIDPATSTTMTLATPSTNTSCELQKRVLLYLKASGVSTTNATVKVSNTGTTTSAKTWNYTYSASGTITGSGYDPAAAAGQLDRLAVTVTVPYANVDWSPLSYFIGQSTTMTATANWNSMVDVPLTVSTTIPSKPLLPTDPLP